jgi:hypothetical protein
MSMFEVVQRRTPFSGAKRFIVSLCYKDTLLHSKGDFVRFATERSKKSRSGLKTGAAF